MLRIFCDDDCLKNEGFWSLRKTKHPFPDSSLAARARRALLNEGFPGKPYVAQPSSSPLALAKEITQKLVRELAAKKIKTDSRGNRLRFGFGLYHNADTIQQACDIIGRYF